MDIIAKEKEQPFDAGCENMSGMIRRVLVHHEGRFYIVSENTVMEETLIFPATPTGEVESWHEVGGGKGLTVEDVLADFEEHFYGYF
jgi:hypothetical protein